MVVTLMQRWLAHRNASVFRNAVTGGALVVIPTFARMLLSPWLGHELWFPTYYPATLAAGLLLGWGGATAVWLIGGVTAFFLFVPAGAGAGLLSFKIFALTIYFLCSGMVLLAAIMLRTALERLQAIHEREHILAGELKHRIKNFLAIVQGLASQTARHSTDKADFQEKFAGRLAAYQVALDLASQNEWQNCELPAFAETVLAPFTGSGQLVFRGPTCTIAADACENLALLLHELATNALKYGALSTPTGSVEISWRFIETAEKKAHCELVWQERNGPLVSEPVRSGLGSKLIRAQPGISELSLQYPPSGVTCIMTIELQNQPNPAGEGHVSAIHRRKRSIASRLNSASASGGNFASSALVKD
ncbi:MAG: HWE histidine kinase domain-containing protein [Sphingobium sp.]